MKSKVLAVAFAAVLATGCAASADESSSTDAPSTDAPSTDAPSTDAPSTDEVAVPWDDYAPMVRTTIDDFAVAKDCTELQGQFDIADANNQATMERTGHTNADLMSYIDAKLAGAGCYSPRTLQVGPRTVRLAGCAHSS